MSAVAEQNAYDQAFVELARDTPVAEKEKLFTQSQLLWLWLPLVATWGLMGLELPTAHVMIARLPNVEENLAALGVAFAIFCIVESPIFSMLAAGTVLVSDRGSYLRMRNFNFALGSTLSAVMMIVSIPPVYKFLAETVLALPPNIIQHVWTVLLIFIPCPFCVGYRRFYQGVLVSFGMNKQVGMGTMARVVITIGTMLVLSSFDLSGAVVGAGGCSCGMISEAFISRHMAVKAVRKLLASGGDYGLTYNYISRFYVPLALTGIIGTAINPLMVFFMARGSFPIESLAVYPVLSGVVGFFGAAVIGSHDLVLGCLDDKNKNYPGLKLFNIHVTCLMLLILCTLLFSPLKFWLFGSAYDLPRKLIEFAEPAVIFAVAFLVAHAFAFWARAVLIHARKTTRVTFASLMELVTVAVLMPVLVLYSSLTGVMAAFVTLMAGRLVEFICMFPQYKSVLSRR